MQGSENDKELLKLATNNFKETDICCTLTYQQKPENMTEDINHYNGMLEKYRQKHSMADTPPQGLIDECEAILRGAPPIPTGRGQAVQYRWIGPHAGRSSRQQSKK